MSSGPVTIGCDVLFDGTGLLEDARVTISGDRITDVASPVGDAVVDQRCRTLMPGLIDSHVHVSGYHEGLPAGQPFEPVKHFLRLCIVNGVTTVRDTGNSLETLFYAREWSARYGGPRVFSAGPLLDVPPLTWQFSRIVRDPEDARRHVNRLADEGVDLIKAYRRITPPLMAAIVSAARERDLGVAVDSELTPVRESVRLGVRSAEHMANAVDPDQLQAANGYPAGPAVRAMRWSAVDPDAPAVHSLADEMAERGTWLVPTLLVTRRWTLFDEMVGDPHLAIMAAIMPYHRYLTNLSNPMAQVIGRRFVRKHMPLADLSRSDRKVASAGLDAMGATLTSFAARGVKLAAGTDSPNPSLAPGFSLHQELAEMVRVGLTPIQALRAATRAGGALIGQDDLGAVRPGARADLVLVDGRLDRDIGDLARITAVMKDGVWIDRDDHLGRVLKAVEDG